MLSFFYPRRHTKKHEVIKVFLCVFTTLREKISGRRLYHFGKKPETIFINLGLYSWSGNSASLLVSEEILL